MTTAAGFQAPTRTAYAARVGRRRVILTVIAVLLPGTDPVSTMIECIPLYLLYGLSIVLSRFFMPDGDEAEEHEDLLD